MIQLMKCKEVYGWKLLKSTENGGYALTTMVHVGQLEATMPNYVSNFGSMKSPATVIERDQEAGYPFVA